ncbi:MAG: hypothetical protein V3V41_07840 [Candidatus Heimdallarchaeota archaeon]
MSTDPHTIQRISRKQEATENTNSIALAADNLAFGKHSNAFGNFPVPQQEINRFLSGASNDPYVLKNGKNTHLGQIVYDPTDGLGFHFLWSDVADAHSAGSSPVVITPQENVQQHTYSVRTQSENSGGSATNRKVMRGCKTRMLNWTLDKTTAGIPMKITETFEGRSFGAASLNSGLSTSQPLVYNDGNTRAQQNEYYRANFECRWDIGGLGLGTQNDNVSDYVAAVSGMHLVSNKSIYFDDNKDPDKIITGDRLNMIMIDFYRRDKTAFLEDYLAQPTADLYLNHSIKIFNTATNYLKFNLSKMALNVTMPHVLLSSGQVPVYRVTGEVTSLTMDINDTLAASKYGSS